ncbi:hypothetical protein DE146DRAFT_758381 [Phaeosphaeria sp. MPI-PUGE-AT-0046c]|nr:hypothetical protein DE146DRAFT_758381 [Phaeosphaeria sp. MPI-PUGE-AT-0046c]
MASQPQPSHAEHETGIDDPIIRLAKVTADLRRINKERNLLAKERRDAVLLDAKTRCRNFATEFSACLPREIRDMVYAEVWLQSFERSYRKPNKSLNVDQTNEWWAKRRERDQFYNSPWLYACKEEPCQCYMLSDLPVWVFPLYVGFQVATEAAEAHYRVKYMVVEADSLPDMEAFLTNDHLHMGIKPADHLRCLELQIQATETNELGYEDIEDFAKLKRYLRPLLEIQRKEGFHLNFVLEREGDMPLNALEALKFVVVPFRNAGAIVKITSCFFEDLDDNVSDFYDMSVETWKVKRQMIRNKHHRAYSESFDSESDSSENLSDSEDLEIEEEEVEATSHDDGHIPSD